jgi:hypothetical protein
MSDKTIYLDLQIYWTICLSQQRQRMLRPKTIKESVVIKMDNDGYIKRTTMIKLN